MKFKKLVTGLFAVAGISLLSLTSVVDCIGNTCSEYYWGYSPGEFDQYVVNANLVTPEGTHYDPSGQPISPALIDRLTNEVNDCLTKNFPDGNIPQDIAVASYCHQGTSFKLPINKTSFEVKIANDWIINCDGTQQVLPKPVEAGDGGCLAKGQSPTPSCPCRWRGGIQCPDKLIVTPSFYIYKDVLIRLVTGCANPWVRQEFAECASPSTTPLSDGTDPNNGL